MSANQAGGSGGFHVVKWVRETCDRYYEETKDITFEQRQRRWDEQERSDPFFSKHPRARLVKPRAGAADDEA